MPHQDGPLCSINDVIHGLQRLSPTEIAIVNHLFFQRLRGIKQTGFCEFHAPSATHTRFEHSLGVVAMATRMLNALFANAGANQDKLVPWNVRHQHENVGVDVRGIRASDRAWLYEHTRYAALVHDLGHGPFSHVFEVFLPTFDEAQHLLNDPRIKKLRPLIEAWRAQHPKEQRLTHEILSCILFTVIWREIHGKKRLSAAAQRAPLVVSAVLLGLANDSSAELLKLSPERRELLPLLSEIISSAPADADRIDYLLRDQRAMGTKLAAFDTERILKSLLAVRVGDGLHVGWKRSGLIALEQFMQARYAMFVEMYGHKTNEAASLMLGTVHAAYTRATLTSPVSTSDLDAFLRTFTGLSDERFLGFIAGTDGSSPDLFRVRAIGRALQQRTLWRCVFDTAMQVSLPEDAKQVAEKVFDHLRTAFPATSFHLAQRAVRATKDLNKGARLAILRCVNGQQRYLVREADASWLVASPIMETLRAQEGQRYRLFVELPEGARSSRPYKNEALRYLETLHSA